MITRKEIELYLRLDRVLVKREGLFSKKMENKYWELGRKIDEQNWKLIYKEACRVIDNDGMNQFDMARRYADVVLNDSNYFTNDSHWEISQFHTKKGLGAVVVDLCCGRLK